MGPLVFQQGLIYIPGTYTKTPEIVELAKVAAKYNGVYTTHMRDEGDSVTYAINGHWPSDGKQRSRWRYLIFKLSGQQNWGRSKETVPMIEAAKRGIEVTIDQYPYTASSTPLVH
jgi:N-acyl-D-amino-acid deacylase